MRKFILATIGVMGFGLTNQINALINAIVIGLLENKPYIILKNFNQNYNTPSLCPISDIIDLNHLNTFLSKYQLTVIDKNYLDFEVLSVHYGTYHHFFDITHILQEKFKKDGSIFIPKHTNMNGIMGDPIPATRKKIIVKYKINKIIDYEVYDEYLADDIILDPLKISQSDALNLPNKYHLTLFNEILKELKFTEKFNLLSFDFVKSLNVTPTVNVIHIRNEEDAIPFWGSINKMPLYEFKEYLNDKYISLIKKYFDVSDDILILTNDTTSDVIKFLENNNYKFHFTNKGLMHGRELNAIIDLLIGEYCSGTFIGNFNPDNFHGSTFSYMIWKRLASSTKTILIDLDDIKREEFVISA